MADQQQSFWARLKQHHIYRVGVGYGTAIVVLIQVVARAFPYFGWSAAVPAVIIILIAGFPVVLVLAWLLVKPADPASQTLWQRRHWKIGALVIPVVIAAVGASSFYAWHFSERHARLLAAANSSAPAAAKVIPAKSVAVLPFVNESDDKNQQYFSDGLSEDLINALSQFVGLKVISRDSSFRFRGGNDSSAEIGDKLGVAHLLEGSVQRAGDEVRISAELVNASDGSTLWSQRYDKPYKDLFALQDTITQAVAAALKARLLDTVSGAAPQSDRPPNGSLAAYDAYLKGKFYSQAGTEAGSRQAISQFNEAVRLDPNYAMAYAASAGEWIGMAATYLTKASNISNAYTQARTAIAMALRLNSDLAAAYEIREGLMVAVDFDWAGALADAQRAMELDPGSVAAKFTLGDIQARLGHVQAAVELDQQALTAAPLNGLGYFGLGRKLIGLGRLDEAQTALSKAIQLAPGASRPYTYLALINIMRGNAAAALAAAQQEPVGYWHDFAVALALQINPDRTAANSALKNMISKYAAGASYQIAEIYALRRDPDNMFVWLEHARVNRDAGIELMSFDPLILRYRHDPRFAAFCKKVGLPTTTDAVPMP